MRELLITSSVLILALLALRRVFWGTLSRRVQYALWALVLVRLLVPVNLPAADFSVLTASQPVRQAVVDRFEAVEPVYLPLDRPPIRHPAAPDLDPAQATAPTGSQAPAAQTGDPAVQYRRTSAGGLFSALWKTGMVVMGGWFLLSNARFYGKLRKNRRVYETSSRRRVYLLPQGVLPSPCLLGRSIYLTPEAVETPEKLRHVLAHEETHARHLDPLWALLRCVCLTVYWFDPLVWLAAACAKTDCELACDEGALARLGEAERIPYGKTLLSLIPVKKGPYGPMLSATTMTAGKKRLKDRFTRIAQKPRQLGAAALGAAVLAALVSACTFTGAKPSGSPDPAGETAAVISLKGLAPYGDAGDILDENGDLTLPDESQGDSSLIDLDGDGRNELVSSRQLFFRRDGQVYRAQLDALLLDECPELGYWNREEWDLYGRSLYVNGLTDWDETKGMALWERELYFDGENILVYKPSKSATDHVVDGIAADVPPQVVEQAKAYAEDMFLQAERNGQEARAKAEEDSPVSLRPEGTTWNWGEAPRYDDWRIESFHGPYTYAFGDAVLEGWGFNYELHTAQPEKVVWAGGKYVTEDGWVSPGYPGCDFLFFQREPEGGLTFLWSGFYQEDMDSVSVRGSLLQDMEAAGMDVSPTTYAALEAALRVESLSYGGEVTVQPLGAGGRTLALDREGKEVLAGLTDPERVTWSRVEPPAQEPAGDSVVLRDSDWYDVLQFWEGSDLVKLQNTNRPEAVWYLAERRRDTGAPLDPSRPYDQVRALYDQGG